MKKLLLLIVHLTFAAIGYAQNFDEITKAIASDRAADDLLGISVSISGNYAIVGSPRESEDASGGNTMGFAGSAYVFERDSSGNWIEAQKIVASDRADTVFFGVSVSISGNYAIVGAQIEAKDASGGNTMPEAGAAYVYERDSSGNWIEAQKIVASDRAANDEFGVSVSISGNYAIVGTYLEDEDASGGNTMSGSGSAYVFERDSSGNWIEAQKIVASDRAASDLFGISTSISGNHAIVGAILEDEDTAGANTASSSGSAYIFQRDSSGNWIESQKIVASDRDVDDWFGFSVSISGNYAVVGAQQEDQDTSGGNTLFNPGSAYIFELDSAGNWMEAQKIVASDRAANDYFGISISISGNYAVVGAHQEDQDTSGGNTLSNAGSVYVFERDSSGNWNEVQKIVAPDRAANDEFGISLAISGDYAIVGAYLDDKDTSGGNIMSDAGSAYVFESSILLGIIENDFNSQVFVYPNPNNGNFSISLIDVHELLIISIYNISGKLISTQKINQTDHINVHIPGAAGIYFIAIQSGKRKVTLKAIKE